MKKFYSLALILLTLFSCVVFSACGDKYKDLKINVYSQEGVAIDEYKYIIDEGNRGESQKLHIEISGVKKNDIGQIVVYSLPNELITVENYQYNGSKVQVDFVPNMASDQDAKLIISHLASGKKKQISLKIEQKAKDLNITNSQYLISIPNYGEVEHSVDLSKVLNLLPYGSTDKIYFKIDESHHLPSGVTPIEIEEIEELENVCSGLKVSSEVVDGSFIKIYPVTYMEDYTNENPKEYPNKEITVNFKRTLNASNVEIKTEADVSNDDIRLIVNDETLSSLKFNLWYLGLTDEDSDDKPLNSEDLDFFDMYEIEIVSTNDSLVSALIVANNDIVITAHAYTNQHIPVKIILKPINYVGDLAPVELTVHVKGELRSDSIEVSKNGDIVSTSSKIDIFDYYEEGNSLGALFMFEAKTSLGTVNKDLSKMRILVDSSILSEENAIDNKEKVNSTLYSLQFYFYDRTVGNKVEILKFSYDSALDKMVSYQPLSNTTQPISNISRVYIKYIKGGGDVESANFGISVETINTSEMTYWETVKSTSTDLNFNRIEGVRDMELQVGSFEFIPDTLKYLYNPVDGLNGYVYLNRLNGLGNLSVDTNYIDIERGSVLGIDGQKVSKTSFTVKVEALGEVDQPLHLYFGHAEKDTNDGTIRTIGSKELIYNYSEGDDVISIISLVYRANTSIGKYKISFSQEGIERASLICVVYEDLTSIAKEGVTFETNEKAFKNTQYLDYKADYIVASKQDLNVSISLPNEVLDSEIVTEYGFNFKVGVRDEDTKEIFEIVDDPTKYFNLKQDDPTFNNALLSFINGTHIDKPQYVYLTITVFTKTYEDIVTEKTEKVAGHNYPSITISFYIYEEITRDNVSINQTYMTRYYKEYLSVDYGHLSSAELKIQMEDDLWNYVTTKEDIEWLIDNDSCVITSDNQETHSFSLEFRTDVFYREYSRIVKAYIQQFDDIIEFQCVFHVEKPILTERLIIDSLIEINEDNHNPYINLKKGDTYELKATNYSSKGAVTNSGVVIQVADKNGSAYNASTYINVNQDTSTIEVKKVEGAKNLKLIVFAKDVLSEVVSSDKSGYNNPSKFIMQNLPDSEREQYENAYFVIDIILSDGSEENPYLIQTANEFWAIDDKEEHRTSYYQVMSSISLDNTTDANQKTITNFAGTITTFNNNLYTFDGITLNAETMNVFANFKGKISNIKFVVDYRYNIVDNSSWKNYYLGIFDTNGGTLTNVSVEVSGKVQLDGNATYYFGSLAGENKSIVQYKEMDLDGDGEQDDGVVGVAGNIILNGNATVYFGGLVGRNVSSILGCETENVGGKNKIVLSGAQGREKAVSLITVEESTLAGNSAVGGIVGLNTYYDDSDDSLDTVGTVQNAFVQANINATSTSNVGGAIGKNEQNPSSINVVLYDGNISSIDNILADSYKNKAIYNVKSASFIMAKNNVGGIVGFDINGLFIECDYQVLTSSSTQSPIVANRNVGGIAGSSQYGKFAYCSVMSYKWDYAKLKTDKSQVVTSTVADILGQNNVGGIVGSSTSRSYQDGSFAGGQVLDSVIVAYSSVNAYLKSDEKIGGILSSASGNAIMFSIYFIGKLDGTVVYDAGLCLDGDASSIYNLAYSFNVNDMQAVSVFNGAPFDINNKFNETNFAQDLGKAYWWWNQNINGGYIFVTTDTSSNTNKLPIFDLAPNSISVEVKDTLLEGVDDSDKELLKRVLMLNYYDFSIDPSLTQEEVLALKQKVNIDNLLNLVQVTAEPSNLGTVVVNVKSTNTTIIDITFDGRIIINGTGECELVFSSALNPNAGNIKNRTIKVIVDYPIGDDANFKIRNNRGYVDVNNTENIAKGTTRQYYAVTGGYRNGVQYKTKSNIYLKVEVSHDVLNPKDYISITGHEDTANSTSTTLVMILDDKTPFMISALKKLENGKFSVKVTPYRVVKNLNDQEVSVKYAYNATFDIMTLVGITNASFSYDEAIVYPNDTIYLTMTLATDKALCANGDGTINVSALELMLKELINNNYAGTPELLFNVYKSNSNILYNIYCDRSSYDQDALIQTITLRIEFDEMDLTDEEILNFEIKVKNLDNTYDTLNGVNYIIIPQRINKIEIKNYYYQNEYDENGIVVSRKLVQQDILKPNNYGKILIDIVPDNGYYDYLEISDITGDEEIVFIQVDENDNALSLIYDPSSDGKGIKLYHYEGQNKSRIYVRTQISNEYSSKMHTIQVRAYSSNGTLLTAFNKAIDVKMLPEIKATYLLPDGTDSTIIAGNGTNQNSEVSGAYLANGVDAHFRIESKNSNSELEYLISGDAASNYEFVQDVDNFYILKSKMYDVNNVGKTIKLTLKTSYVGNGEVDTAECSIEFTIVEFVVHKLSVSGSVNNEISGYFGRDVKLEFYFDKYDVSFYDTETVSDNLFWDTRYQYGENTPDQINEVLAELNSYETDGSNKYLILNDNTKTMSGYNVVTSDKITIKNNTLKVYDGYNKEVLNEGEANEQEIDAPKYLAVALRLYSIDNNWSIETYQERTQADFGYVVDVNYHLNFREATKWYEPTVVNTVEDFLKMSSGGNYILNSDLSLENYTPLNVNLVQFDGNGHTIEIKSFASFNDASLKAGLFAQIYADMIVKNVKVKYTSYSNKINGWTFGRVDGKNNMITYLDLCNNSTVSYTDVKFGGLTALNEGIITNCVVEGEIAIHASTLEARSAGGGGSYEISFNVGGMVAENTNTGYITNSMSELHIFAQANIGGFVHTNYGKIVSCGVEENTTIYGYNVNLGNTINVKIAGFSVQNSGEISMSYVNLKHGERVIDSIYYGTISAKDISAGFVYSNSGKIYDAFVQMSAIGVNSNTFAGFVYSNSGQIQRSYTFINGGVKGDSNESMFAPVGTANLTNCAEIVSVRSGYSNGIETGLLTINVVNRFEKSIYENLSFAFGDNKSAVWKISNSSVPKLVSTSELTFDEFMPAQIKSTTELIDGVETTIYDFNLMFANYGTKENPYIVHDLESWNNYFNESLTEKTSYYRIVKDIDFSSVGGNPSTSSMTFSGNIQGNNMKLSNIMLYSNENLSSIGLFERLEGVKTMNVENAVRNLTLTASSVWASSTRTVGVLAGIIKDFNVYNITIDSPGVIMVGGNAVGGVAGLVAGEFDLDKLSSNIGASSTRASTLHNYSIYMSRNNKKNEMYNLDDVYYAGSVVGILDGFGGNFDIDNRYVNKNYFMVRNISVSGDVTISGDTAGGAFGLVGEKVHVKNMEIDIAGSVFGSEYSSGAVGENRGIVNQAIVTLADDLFKKSKNVSSGAVGFNLGGLITDVTVHAKIMKSEHLHTVAGILGRNIYGTIVNSHFDGELFGYYTGGIVGANYNSTILSDRTTGSGALSLQCVTNKYLIPSAQVNYFENTKHIVNFSNVSLSRATLDYLIENSNKYYSYANNEEVRDLSGITLEVRVLGLVVGLSYNSSIVNKVTEGVFSNCYAIELTEDEIVFNVENHNELSGIRFETLLENVELCKIDATKTVLYTFENVNVLTISAGGNYVMYLVGAQATSFDSWSVYTNEYLLVK